MSFRVLIIDIHEAHRKVMVGFVNHLRPDVEIHQLDPSVGGRPHSDFDWTGYKLIIMDSSLGDEDGLEWFQDYSACFDRFPPVLFLSSQNRVEVAVKAMKLGAIDFIAKKNINQELLKEAIMSAIPPPPPKDDLMPDLKPLPDHHNTMQYSGAETQVLTPQHGGSASSVVEEVEDVDESDEDYWDQQTQILNAPPS